MVVMESKEKRGSESHSHFVLRLRNSAFFLVRRHWLVTARLRRSFIAEIMSNTMVRGS